MNRDQVLLGVETVHLHQPVLVRRPPVDDQIDEVVELVALGRCSNCSARATASGWKPKVSGSARSFASGSWMSTQRLSPERSRSAMPSLVAGRRKPRGAEQAGAHSQRRQRKRASRLQHDQDGDDHPEGAICPSPGTRTFIPKMLATRVREQDHGHDREQLEPVLLLVRDEGLVVDSSLRSPPCSCRAGPRPARRRRRCRRSRGRGPRAGTARSTARACAPSSARA